MTMYRDRKIEKAIKEVADSFPCIVVYGSRQVGKSTMNTIRMAKRYPAGMQ